MSDWKALAATLDLTEEPRVVATHRSKSIECPVVLFAHGPLRVLARDNFHNVNVLVIDRIDLYHKDHASLRARRAALTWEVVYGKPQGAAWYDDEMQRCARYCWEDATEAVLWDRAGTDARARRWLTRGASTAWYGHDWANGKLFAVSEAGEDVSNRLPLDCSKVQFFKADHAFAEGIARALSALTDLPVESIRLPDLWEPGARSFLVVRGDTSLISRILPTRNEDLS